MDFDQAIKATAKEFLAQAVASRQPQASQAEEEALPPQPVDTFQQRRVARREQPAPRSYGAMKRMLLDLDQLIENTDIEHEYKKAIDVCESLKAEGENQRAEMVRQQYMEDAFLPLVDALIRLYSEEEVLASQDALETLDSLAMTLGGGKTDGYTSVYVSSMYEPVAGQTFTTDAEVADGIRRINMLCDRHNIKSAVGIASRLLDSITMGQNRATPDDYEFLQKIALRG